MEIMKSCKFKTSKISRLSRNNDTKSPGIRDGNFPQKSREITSGNPGRETLFEVRYLTNRLFGCFFFAASHDFILIPNWKIKFKKSFEISIWIWKYNFWLKNRKTAKSVHIFVGFVVKDPKLGKYNIVGCKICPLYFCCSFSFILLIFLWLFLRRKWCE